jgi:hypothetical protein
MTRLLLILSIITVVPSCLIVPHYETLTGKVSGCVVNAKGQPVSGAIIDYHLRSDRRLGTTISDSSGNFEFGPFWQWFYLVYVGSPGVCPVPYLLLADPELPDAIKVTNDGGIAVYCLGDFETHKERIKDNHGSSEFELISKARWAGNRTPITLVITPLMRDRLPPRRVFHPPPVPVYTNR